MPKVAAEAAEATAAMVPRGTSRRPAPEPDPEPTEVAVPDAVEELVPTNGQAMGKHEGAKIIAFRPRKVPA
jgi:hypothetical protein